MTPQYHCSNRPLKHGGARNSGSRVSDILNERQCANIIAAAYLAYRSRNEFNRFITIHWQKGGIGDHNAAKATGQFIKYCSDWMRRHNHRLTWLWVRENDGNIGRIGSHVHILIHVPSELAPLFRPFPLRWVKRILPTKYVRRTLMTKTIPGHSSVTTYPARYLVNLERVVEYLLKAITFKKAKLLNLKLYERRGLVAGKRSAVCQYLLAIIKAHPRQFEW